MKGGENASPLAKAVVQPLWPPGPPQMLVGLYLAHDLRAIAHKASFPLIYANYVSSLDGRIALGKGGVPPSLANSRDWWLFQELAVQADAVMVSGRYLRDRARGTAQDLFAAFSMPHYASLRAWRSEHALPSWPKIVVLSRELNCPLPSDVSAEHFLFLTGEKACDSFQAREFRQAGASVSAAGEHADVNARMIPEILAGFGLQTVYAIGGSNMLHLMAESGILSRLYLTQVNRLLGGQSFASLLGGKALTPPIDLRMHRLYYDTTGPGVGGQLFACYLVSEANEQSYLSGG